MGQKGLNAPFPRFIFLIYFFKIRILLQKIDPWRRFCHTSVVTLFWGEIVIFKITTQKIKPWRTWRGFSVKRQRIVKMWG